MTGRPDGLLISMIEIDGPFKDTVTSRFYHQINRRPPPSNPGPGHEIYLPKSELMQTRRTRAGHPPHFGAGARSQG